jgi:hypothetical protein
MRLPARGFAAQKSFSRPRLTPMCIVRLSPTPDVPTRPHQPLKMSTERALKAQRDEWIALAEELREFQRRHFQAKQESLDRS